MRKIFLLAVLAFSISFTYAQAQQEKTSHYKAAEDLMMAMNMPQNVDATIPQMVELQIQGNPMMASKKDAFTAFMMKHVSWQAIGDEMTKIYMQEFSEADLKALAVFYKTDLGKKLAASHNALTMKGSHLGQRKVQENMAELMQVLQ
ncbi:DUF2059 domain-containing protein [Aridibaculum aurantiacum]|uniref:DUF2059 domain-containing protein n=1 Tax=Aridibaculum aurantiacum TaxID=2810307 RepID=UPI001A9642FE|nr:DUF2059 domain-containing protein [Aridibaculum aurantiacum]